MHIFTKKINRKYETSLAFQDFSLGWRQSLCKLLSEMVYRCCRWNMENRKISLGPVTNECNGGAAWVDTAISLAFILLGKGKNLSICTWHSHVGASIYPVGIQCLSSTAIPGYAQPPRYGYYICYFGSVFSWSIGFYSQIHERN